MRRSRTRFAEATTGGYASIIAKMTRLSSRNFFYFTQNLLSQSGQSVAPSLSKPSPVSHLLPVVNHGCPHPLQQPTPPCDNKNQRRSPAMTCPWHRPPGQVCLLKWTPNLFPRNSCHTLRSLFGGSHVAPRSPQFRFSKWGDVRHLHRTAFGAVQVRTEGSGTLEFFYLYWLW